MDPNDISKHITPRKDASAVWPPRPQRKRPERKVEPLSTKELIGKIRAEELILMPYAEYLQTPEWQERRKEALKNARHRCQVCNSAERLDVHHRTYERRGREDIEDLTVLCRSCHEHFHKHTSKEKPQEHVHNFKVKAKKKCTIRWCVTCEKSYMLIRENNESYWKEIGLDAYGADH